MKIVAAMTGSILVLLGTMGTAWADYTSTPSPTAVAHGAGGGTAFTGGDVSGALIVGAVLVALGGLALLSSRWLARRT